MKLRLSGKTIANMTAGLAVTLMALGVVFVFSASAKIDFEYDLSKFYSYPEFKQAGFFLISILILFGLSLINYRVLAFKSARLISWVLNPAVWLVFVSIILLVMVLIPGIGMEINYARRWLRIPLGPASLNFQPSELAKWSLVLFVPAVCALLGEKIKKFRNFAILCVIIGLIAGLIVIEDFGTAIFIVFVSFVILFVAGAKWWHFLTPLPILAILFAAAIITSPERRERIKTFINPDSNSAQTSGYQIKQSLIAISTGRILGKGLGGGISKYGHLPEDTTDFIFAIISEELGFVGVCFVILLFMLFLILGIVIIRRCDNDLGKLLAFGIVLAITAQAVMNLGVVTRLLPTKGIALPFVSAGGTHLFLTAAAVGVLMSIARRTDN
ncbi:MAG: FtsW/RodA/SpoVE family cell cycle protein [Sedimentisphaerales bacterium]